MKVLSLVANCSVHGISWALIKFQKIPALERGSKIKEKKSILHKE